MMFTKDQGQELVDNTTYEWLGSGVKLTSKINSSKYIFFPIAGTYAAGRSNRDVTCTWSTTYSGSSSAYYLSIGLSEYKPSVYVTSTNYRYQGTSIRAVR